MATLEERQAERDKLKQARTVIDSQGYTREDYRHRMEMEPVRGVTIAPAAWWRSGSGRPARS